MYITYNKHIYVPNNIFVNFPLCWLFLLLLQTECNASAAFLSAVAFELIKFDRLFKQPISCRCGPITLSAISNRPLSASTLSGQVSQTCHKMSFTLSTLPFVHISKR